MFPLIECICTLQCKHHCPSFLSSILQQLSVLNSGHTHCTPLESVFQRTIHDFHASLVSTYSLAFLVCLGQEGTFTDCTHAHMHTHTYTHTHPHAHHMHISTCTPSQPGSTNNSGPSSDVPSTKCINFSQLITNFINIFKSMAREECLSEAHLDIGINQFRTILDEFTKQM